MDDKANAIYDFVMERCLWQFFSRSWDREDNIHSIMSNVAKLQSGQTVDRTTNIANSHYADAKILTEQLTARYPWFAGLSPNEVKGICDKVGEKLLDITVVNSLNAERTDPKY